MPNKKHSPLQLNLQARKFGQSESHLSLADKKDAKNISCLVNYPINLLLYTIMVNGIMLLFKLRSANNEYIVFLYKFLLRC